MERERDEVSRAGVWWACAASTMQQATLDECSV